MTLLSPMALLFAMAALVPLLLHLYQRRRRVVVLFSTNRFFTKSVVRSQRRLKLRRLLLLMLRMTACILFAVALARPILGLAGLTGAGAGTRDIVVLLDDSLSMQATEGGGDDGVRPLNDIRGQTSASGAMPASRGTVAQHANQDSLGDGHVAPEGEKTSDGPGTLPTTTSSPTRLDRAKAAALEVLNSLAAGDRAAVVTSSGRTLGQDSHGGMQLTSDIARLVEQVQQLAALPAAGDGPGALRQAAELLKGGSQRARSLLILTDLQAGDWGRTAWPQPQTAVRSVLARLDPPTRNNLFIEQVLLGQGTAVVGQPNLLRVRLVNTRAQPARTRIALEVDGRQVASRPVELPAGGPQVERIPVIFDKPGQHALRVSIDVADALVADNTFYATVQVNPRLPVLLVSGDIDTAREKSAAFYLQAALESVSDDPAADSIPVQVVAPADLAGLKLDRYRVVILSNVPSLPAAQVGPLEQFVQAGGGLAILLGDRCDAKFYNDVLGAKTRPLGSLLPADIRSRLGAENAGEPLHIVEADVDHPLLARFKGPLRGALAGIRIYQAYGLAPRDGLTLASMDSRMPLIVERRFGQGRTILLATLPKPSWTDWPVRRTFIPLASSLVNYLAGGASTVADQPACQDLPLRTPVRSADQPPKVHRPDGSLVQAQVKMAGGEAVAYLPASMVDQVGQYHVETAPAAGEILAVNTLRRESSTDTLDPEEAARLAGRWQLTTVDLTRSGQAGLGRTPGSLMASLSTAPGSMGIWNTLLWLVLGIVALEPLVANRRTTAGGNEQQG